MLLTDICDSTRRATELGDQRWREQLERHNEVAQRTVGRICGRAIKSTGDAPQRLTPLQLIGRLAALVLSPRIHRHRYFGVLAPNAPLRAAVTAMAMQAVPPAADMAPTHPAPPADEPIRRPPLWEMPRARHRAIDSQAQPARDYEFDQRTAW